MRNKFIKIITAVLLASIAVTMMPKAYTSAAVKEAYTVSTSYSYKNPETGKTADGSTNIALGESMIGSMLEPTALVEEVGGKTYVTIGLGLMSNVSKVTIKTGTSSGTYANASITKTGSVSKNGDTVNQYRFQVSSVENYISPILYIDPMGRDVQFYVSLKMNTKKSGSGAYKALLAGSKDNVKQTEAPKVTEAPKKTEAPAATKQPSSDVTRKPTETPVATEQTKEVAETVAPTEHAVNAEEVATGQSEQEEKTDHTRVICFSMIGVSVLGMLLILGGHYVKERKRRGNDHE